MKHQFDLRTNEYTGEGIIASCRCCGLEVDNLESKDVASCVLRLRIEAQALPGTCEEHVVEEVHRL